MNNKNSVNPNAVAEAATVELLANIFNGVSYIDAETVRSNIEAACEGGWSETDRSINAERANRLIDNFAFIYMGLIVNEEFRNRFREAVSIEISLDDKDSRTIEKLRRDMGEGTKPVLSSECYTLNLTVYNEDLYKRLNGRLLKSFEEISDYDDALSDLIDELTDDNKVDIGFCVSNFMYLIRALDKNPMFFDYVKDTLEAVKGNLAI